MIAQGESILDRLVLGRSKKQDYEKVEDWS